MSVVLDANVFVSGAIQKGASFRIVQRWLAGADFEVIMCPVRLAEITDVLTERPRLRKWIDLTAAKGYIDTISTLVDLVADPAPIDPATRDVDDDYLVALAREHSADYIVTGDKDFLEWEHQTPPAITPAAFDELLGAPVVSSGRERIRSSLDAVRGLATAGRRQMPGGGGLFKSPLPGR